MKQSFLFLILALAACTTTIPSDMHPPLLTPPPLPDLRESSLDNITEVRIDAQQFEFLPSRIDLTKGERVRLILTARDVNHTFVLPEFGIDEELEVGEDTRIDFWPNKTGFYLFYCDKPGHKMEGIINVR
ncbi:MAG TPA: cupredoxin domain-containing protein [Candidatus Nanoarchaeia archaeon]|nr:cupredoxin domain-containing protein [Candidatus Nanoarchaeia archaeon]